MVDKQWHLSSSTPYDPPLTYGGWLQSQNLGARIAAILRERELEFELEDEAVDEAAAGPAQVRVAGKEAGAKKKRRRYSVVIHSSPFLRCVQTSVAISAGLASNPSPFSASLADLPPSLATLRLGQDGKGGQAAGRAVVINKCILRLDPFLGEWLTPDYFEHTTPPPRADVLLMTAKAELLRRENYGNYPDLGAARHTSGSSPTRPSQLWNAPARPSPAASHGEAVNADSSNDKEAQSPSSGPSRSTAGDGGWVDRSSEPKALVGYEAPVPSYAMSSSASIPGGYVNHARDACMDFDYQWDSSRDSLAWGEGGELPEEWAGMHQRFRRGLRRLVEWYSTADRPGDMVTKKPRSQECKNEPEAEAEAEADDVETETVVILVSHGAGCNALVGGITNQPVLADVPMSSLTVARRRTESDELMRKLNPRQVSSLDDALPRSRLKIPDLYEMKLFANTDHLHSPALTPRTGSGAGLGESGTRPTAPARDPRAESRRSDSPLGVGRSNSANASLGSMRRPPNAYAYGGPSSKGGITVGSGVTSFSSGSRTRTSSGLWAPKLEAEPEVDELDMPMTLDFSHEKTEAKNKAPSKTAEEEEEERTMAASSSATGAEAEAEANQVSDRSPAAEPRLWSGTGVASGLIARTPRPAGQAEGPQDTSAHKRRWTVNEGSA